MPVLQPDSSSEPCKNRFWLRASMTTPTGARAAAKHKLGTRWKWWIIWDAATDFGVGPITDDFEALVQQLRSMRAKHQESLAAPAVWHTDRKYLS